jgi:hypothetical protein
MALTLPDATRNASVNAVTALINQGSGTATGYLVLGTSAMAVTLVSLAFNATAYANAVAGVATANAIANGTVINAGTAVEAKIINRDGTTVISGLTVSMTSGNVVITNNVLALNDVVSASVSTITQPAS